MLSWWKPREITGIEIIFCTLEYSVFRLCGKLLSTPDFQIHCNVEWPPIVFLDRDGDFCSSLYHVSGDYYTDNGWHLRFHYRSTKMVNCYSSLFLTHGWHLTFSVRILQKSKPLEQIQSNWFSKIKCGNIGFARDPKLLNSHLGIIITSSPFYTTIQGFQN